MFDINELYDGDLLLEGHYRLLKRLSEDGTLGLAVDTEGVANTLSNGEDNFAIDESSCSQVIIRFVLPKSTSDIEDERPSDDEWKEVQEYCHINQSQPVYSSAFKGTFGEEISYDVFPFNNNISSKPLIPRKPLYITLVVICLLLFGGCVYLYLHKPFDIPPETPKPPVEPTVERAEELLRSGSFTEGVNMLDTLINMHDYRAAFIKSRLYYVPQEGDRFYEESDAIKFYKEWDDIGKKCDIRKDDIVKNNKEAHELLFKAFDMCQDNQDNYKDDDWMMLFSLGCDYKAGERFGHHGCVQNSDYACWCFKEAVSILDTIKYPDIYHEINEELENLDCNNPPKPEKP